MISYSEKNLSRTKELVLNGLLISLVFIGTKFINIRLPISINGGLIHMGNVMLFMISLVFGPRRGAISGAFGMAIFDILSGWITWAPFTFIIRGLMGYVIGKIAYGENSSGKNFFKNLFGIFVGGIIMITGYYITEVILYGNFLAPITSIPGNIVQILIGAIVGLPFAKALKKTNIL
jgi:uncharacterized membrane protein